MAILDQSMNPVVNFGVFRVFLKSGSSFDVVCEDINIVRNPLNGVITNVHFNGVDGNNPVPLYIETGSIAAIVAMRMPVKASNPVPPQIEQTTPEEGDGEEQ